MKKIDVISIFVILMIGQNSSIMSAAKDVATYYEQETRKKWSDLNSTIQKIQWAKLFEKHKSTKSIPKAGVLAPKIKEVPKTETKTSTIPATKAPTKTAIKTTTIPPTKTPTKVVIKTTTLVPTKSPTKQAQKIITVPPTKALAKAISLHIKEKSEEKLQEISKSNAQELKTKLKDTETATNALLSAIWDNKIEDAKKAIDDGANLKPKQEKHKPLIEAIKRNNFQMVELLLENGADPNSYFDGQYYTIAPLIIDIWYGSIEIARLLLKYGANVNNIQDYKGHIKSGDIPLILALSLKKENFVKFLLENNADVNLKPLEGPSFLEIIQSDPKKYKPYLDIYNNIQKRQIIKEMQKAPAIKALPPGIESDIIQGYIDVE